MLSAAMIVSFSQCSKEGLQGSQGEQGLQGEKGERGPVGPAGENGNMIYSGNGIPKADVGNPGDFYLDVNTGSLYGPKTDKGWDGKPAIVLMGQDGKDGKDGEDGKDGINGKDGSTVFAGRLKKQINPLRPPLPSSKIGRNGDFFLDKTNYNLFGPKKEGKWGGPINLKGLKGEKGDPGTANVLYSNWRNLNFSDFDGDNINTATFYTSLSDSLLIDIFHKGDLSIYVRIPDSDYSIFNIYRLNYYEISSTGTVLNFFKFSLSYKNREYAEILIDSNADILDLIYNYSFRYVIIPGGVHARTASAPDMDDYHAVCEYYGIPE